MKSTHVREGMFRIITSFILFVFAISIQGAAGDSLKLISKPFQAQPSTFGDSSDIEVSADGKWSVFVSSGTGVTTNDPVEFSLDVFLRNNETGEIILLSRNSDNSAGNGDSFAALLSADGRYVVFETEADDLVPDDDNETSDVVLYDRTSGELSLVSGTTNGVTAGTSAVSAMTSNGRFILFESDSTEFSNIDTNDAVDLFLFERETGRIQLVTVNSNNTATAHPSNPFHGTFDASVSEDGRYVAFVSSATNHIRGLPLRTGISPQLYLRDLVAGTNIWLNRGSNNFAPALGQSPVVSRDSSRVVFLSGDLNSTTTTSQDAYLYIYEMSTGERTVVQALDGRALPVQQFSLSGNGQVLALTSGDHVYSYDIAQKRLETVSGTPTIGPASGSSSSAQISDDGRYVAFSSVSTNLPGNISGKSSQIYRFDRQTGALDLLSRGPAGAEANADTHFPVISGDGSTVGFMSYASNLAPLDNFLANDVFLVAGTNAVTLASTAHPSSISTTANGPSSLEPASLSLDGRYLVFSSTATDIIANDTNGYRDIFLHDLQTGLTRLISGGLGDAATSSPPLLIGMSTNASVIAFSAGMTVNGTNGRGIFIYDTSTGSNHVASILPTGEPTLVFTDAALSANGRYLAFRSTTPSPALIRDLQRSETSLLSPNPTQIFGITPGGRYVVGRTGGGVNLIDWEQRRSVPNLLVPLFSPGSISADESSLLVQPSTPSTTILHKLDGSSTNVPIGTNVLVAAISADGSTVAYQVRTDPVGSANQTYNLFFYDVASKTRTALQIAGTNANFRARGPLALSPDGRYIAFATDSSLTMTPDEDVHSNVYVYDRQSKSIVLASQDHQGGEGDFGSTSPNISANGQVVAFDSSAGDLVIGDKNQAGDVFVRILGVIDSDSDGMDDAWETTHFGNLSATADGDPDNDGVSNLNEFRAGTDPNVGATQLVLATEMDAAANKLRISSPAAAGTYQLEVRSSLSAGAWESAGLPTASAGGSVSFELDLPRQGIGFFRIRRAN